MLFPIRDHCFDPVSYTHLDVYKRQPYNWTQSDASDNDVAIAAGGYADGYDVRIAKIIAEKLGMDFEIVKTEWDGLTPALLSGNIDVIIAGMSPTA